MSGSSDNNYVTYNCGHYGPDMSRRCHVCNKKITKKYPNYLMNKVKEDRNLEYFKDPISRRRLVNPILLNCGHTFSERGIRTWLINNTNCPICKTNVTNTIKDLTLQTELQNITLTTSPESPWDSSEAPNYTPGYNRPDVAIVAPNNSCRDEIVTMISIIFIALITIGSIIITMIFLPNTEAGNTGIPLNVFIVLMEIALICFIGVIFGGFVWLANRNIL